MEGISFVDHIRQLIDREGVTALSKRLGVTRQTIYNWRDSKNMPTTKELEQMGAVVSFPSNVRPYECPNCASSDENHVCYSDPEPMAEE